MLFYFFFPLRDAFGAFNIFRYISFRAAMAAVTAFAISMIFGPPLIRLLKSKKVYEEQCKTDSDELNERRKDRPAIPTMGGCIILLALLVSTLLWGRLDNRFILLGLLGTVGFGIIGFIDDYIKLMYFDRKGLRTASKFFLQIAVSVALTFAIYVLLRNAGNPEFMHVYSPIGKNLYVNLGFWGGIGFFFFALLLIVGTSNAVNLTDGLDGLAPGCLLIASVAMAVVCYMAGRVDFSQYLHIVYVRGSGELTIFCAAMAGATMGFLWFNCHPAQVFMGDTGSLSLGGLLGFIAVSCKQEIMLLIVGGIFFLEAISVILQVGSYRLRGGRRVFLCAPLHHHFQFKKWEDPKITVRFWIVASIFAILGLATLKLR
ncbi:MAG: phospho-N-acetylmuramoyl-pentapeptide-transferase [Planctomycetota bacterium]|jgi:phospho-N-acetylmuramoyl-pentapeptide-transferase